MRLLFVTRARLIIMMGCHTDFVINIVHWRYDWRRPKPNAVTSFQATQTSLLYSTVYGHLTVGANFELLLSSRKTPDRTVRNHENATINISGSIWLLLSHLNFYAIFRRLRWRNRFRFIGSFVDFGSAHRISLAEFTAAECWCLRGGMLSFIFFIIIFPLVNLQWS